MKLTKMAATAAFAVAALGLASGTAYAQPTTTSPAPAPAVGSADLGSSDIESTDITDIAYESTVEDRTVVTTIDAGVFKVSDDGKTVDVLDAQDNVVITLPLSFNLGGLNFPYEYSVDGDSKILRLTPILDFTKASAKSDTLGVTKVASPDENLKAQQNFASQLGLATAIGGLTGTIVGAGLGFLGVALGPLVFATIPTGATLGGVLGTIAVGGPTLVIAGIDLINTLIAPPGTTKFAN